jgi:hypothetical protein
MEDGSWDVNDEEADVNEVAQLLENRPELTPEPDLVRTPTATEDDISMLDTSPTLVATAGDNAPTPLLSPARIVSRTAGTSSAESSCDPWSTESSCSSETSRTSVDSRLESPTDYRAIRAAMVERDLQVPPAPESLVRRARLLRARIGTWRCAFGGPSRWAELHNRTLGEGKSAQNAKQRVVDQLAAGWNLCRALESIFDSEGEVQSEDWFAAAYCDALSMHAEILQGLFVLQPDPHVAVPHLRR